MRFGVLVLLSFIVTLGSFAQTPGLIIKPAQSPGNAVLDPDGDGYVSQKTNGIQLGFTIPPDNDVLQSEIPFVPIVRPDPIGDLERGPTGSFSEIVGVDAAGNNAILTYQDGTNLFYRFRLGGYAPNSKSYSILIDTDGKFGFTGDNADPNAVVGNLGFEAEITLETNFNVKAFNVDGTTSGTLVTSASYDTNCQKSVAVSAAGGDPDYFYDFFLPLSSLTSLFTAATPIRMIGITVMNPNGAIGNNALSDVGGVGAVGNLDLAFQSLMDAQTPALPGAESLERSACPTINDVAATNTVISGTSTEVSGTSITVSVYQSNGTTLIGSGTTTTSGSTWSINVSALSPTVTLATGQKVKATATASGKGVSYNNCSIKTVTATACTVQTSTSGVTIAYIGGSKGYTLTVNKPAGTVIKCYSGNFALIDPIALDLQAPDNLNTVTTTTNPQTVLFKCKTGNCFPNSVYYFTYQSPGECVSNYVSDCNFSNTGTSTAPTISTTPILSTTTSLLGICGNVATPGALINVYANGIFLKSTTVIGASTWTITGLDLSSYACGTITASAADAGKCPSNSVSSVPISRIAVAPSISTSGCSVSAPTTISGYSTEIGATVTLYKTSPTAATLGTAIVAGDGTWTIIPSPVLAVGNVIDAAVTSGTCLSPSVKSASVTISTQTNIASYTIGFTTPTEGQTTLNGTISGGTYPVTIKAYVDEALVGTGTAIGAAGSWSITGLTSFDLAVGSTLKVTLTGAAACESALSSTSTIVQCIVPANKTVTASTTAICANTSGTITLSSSTSGVIYTPVANDEATVLGYSVMGTGSNISLSTYPLSTSPTIVKIKATKFPYGSCDAIMSTSITFTLLPSPADPTGTSPQPYCASGATLAQLVVTVPSGSTLNWYAASSGGTTIPSSTSLVNGTTYYAESVNTTSGCISVSRKAIQVQTGTPPAPTASPSQSFCAGATVANLVATLTSPGTINWFGSASGGSALLSTAALSTGTYYAETAQGTCFSSTRTAVSVTITAIPSITGTTPSAICGSGTLTLGATASAGTVNWYDASTGGTLAGSGTSFTTPGITSTTTYYVSATNNTCTTASRTAVVATIYPTPTITVTSAATCAVDLLTYSVSVTVSSGTVTSTDGNVTNTSGNTWLNDNIPIANSVTLTVTDGNACVNTLPVTAPDCNCDVVSTPVSGGNQTYCAGYTIPALSATVNSGESIDWFSASTGGTELATNTTSYTPTAPGTYYAEAFNTTTDCRSSSRTAITLTENPTPIINNMTASVCTAIGFNSTPSNGFNGTVPLSTTYSWPAPSGTGFTGGAAGSGASSISGTLTNSTGSNQTAVYTVTPVTGGCAGNSFTLTVTVYPTASIISVTGTTPLAIAATTTYTANSAVLGGGTGAWSSSNPSVATVNASSGLVTGIAPGTCNIIYTITGGCGGTVSAYQAVKIVPKVTFTTASQSSANETGTMTVTIQLSAASAETVTVPYTLTGTATSSGGGTDFSITPSPITISAGNTSATITITITGDSFVEGNETVIVTLGTPTNAASGAILVHTATIVDDDVYPANDLDGDGVTNDIDIDDDNDGILDVNEGETGGGFTGTGTLDTDSDGVKDWLDLDSDNDGIYDIFEAGGTDADFNGAADYFVDANGNGLSDQYDPYCTGSSTITGQADVVVSSSGVTNGGVSTVDASSTSYETFSAGGSLIVKLADVVPPGTPTANTISIVMYVVQNNQYSSGTITQSFDNSTYSNPYNYSIYDKVTQTVTYTLSGSNARYIKITNTSDKDSRIYIFQYSFILCNGTTGTAILDLDSDSDGNKDRLEIDSDNDTCNDVKEAGFTDGDNDGKLGTAPVTVNFQGKVTSSANGYTTPADAYSPAGYDYRAYITPAIGGSISGGSSICTGSTSALLTLSGHTGTIIKWQKAVSPYTTWIDIANTTTTHTSVALTQDTQFRVALTNSACGPVYSSTATVTVRPIPTASISGTTTVCQSDPVPNVTFTNPQAYPVTITYTLNGGSNQTINVAASTTATIPISTPGTYIYSLVSVEYQTVSTCLTSISGTVTVTVRPTPTATISGATTVCKTAASPLVTFTNPQTRPITVTYNISGGSPLSVNVAASTTATVAVPTSTAGTYTYNLVSAVYQTAPTCSNTLSGSAAVVVRPTPAATISGTASVCQNATSPNITFTNPVAIPITVTYKINSGGDQTINVAASGSATLPVATTSAGTYIYSLVSVVYQTAPSCSRTVTGSSTVTVRTAATASISGTSSVCQNETTPVLTFTNPQTSPITVTYNINGANQSTINVGASTTATLSAPTSTAGIFVYNLESAAYQTGSTCITAITGTATITVKATPTATIGGTTSLCQNDAAPDITFTNPMAEAITITYNINGSGQTTINVGASTSATLAVSTSTGGDFNYNMESVQYQLAPNCPTTISGTAIVSVVPTPVAPTLSADRPNLCANEVGNVTLTATGGAGTTINWFAGACASTSIGTGSTLVLAVPSSTTTYYARYENSCGNSTCNSVTVNINANPSAPSNFSGDQSICFGASTPNLISVSSNPNPAVDWYTASSAGTLLLSGSNSYTPAVTTAGSYTYYSEARNTVTSCVSTTRTAINYTIHPLPTASLSSNDADNSICSGDEVIFTAGGGSSYEFFLNAVSIQGPSSTDTYTTSTLANNDNLTVEVTTIYGCKATSSGITTTVIVCNTPPVAVNDAATICHGVYNSMNILTNDTDDGTIDPLTTVLDPSGTPVTQGNTYTDGSGNTWVLNATGVLTFTPTTGFTGDATAQYTVKDNGGLSSNVATITITVNQIALSISDISPEPSGSDCPDFNEPFNADNASYNAGSTYIGFRVTRANTSSAWSFDYSLSGGTVYTTTSPNPASATATGLSTDNYIDLVFHILNTPGSAQTIDLNVSNISADSCPGTDVSDAHIIDAMPSVGSFN
ncbi:MAG: PKD-like domain-containing protein [Prolixibacteraceae bacterium]